MERCGKINASNSGADSWTGIGVVAGFCIVVLIMQWPHRRNGEVTWRSELLQRLQEVRGNCKTRNQLIGRNDIRASEMMCPHVRMRMMVGSVVPPPSPSTLPAAPPEM